MSHPRPTPFDLVFVSIADTVFPAIQAALGEKGHDPVDRDTFLMEPEVVSLLHQLRPEGGLGEGIDQLTALVHHAFLFWQAGQQVIEVNQEQLPELSSPAHQRAGKDLEPSACYVRMPERRVWAQVVPGQPHEPLDGCFVHSSDGSAGLRVLGVFGIYPERAGFSVVEAAGRPPSALSRADGSALFAPTLPGGAAAGLYSVTGEEELLELGARSWKLGAASSKLLAPD